MIYVNLPENFVATKFPGYFYKVDENKVYSIKSGVLKPMRIYKPNYWNKQRMDFVVISHRGHRHQLVLEQLKTKDLFKSEIPVIS